MEAQRINRLCEGWQARMQDSTRADQEQFGREFLRLLGWEEPGAMDIAPANTGLAYVLRAGQDTTLVAQFVMPGMLEAPATLRARNTDYCPCTRDIVTALRRSRIQYALITDMHRSFVYDVRGQLLLVAADSPDTFNREIAQQVAHVGVERGSLEELRRPPRSESAQRLRACCEHWSEMIGSTPGGSEALAAMLIDRMLLVSNLAERDIVHRDDWSLRSALREVRSVARGDDPQLAGVQLEAIFNTIWRTFNAQLFQPLPQIRALLEQPAIGAALINDMAMMSPAKFSNDVILESFNSGPADEKARVRIVPEKDPDRDLYLAKQSATSLRDAQLHVDLFEEGYRAIPFWFDRAVATCDRVYAEALRAGPRHGEQSDLLNWSDDDTAPARDPEVSLRHVAESMLHISYATPRQFRIARLLLYLHIARWYAKTETPLRRFPDLESSLHRTHVAAPTPRHPWMR